MESRTPILLIEDDPAQRLLLAAYLSQAGFEVAEAETLAQARTLLGGSPPRLVLLDLDLPDGDGLELARDLRRRELPVIIVSCREGDRVEGLELGADDYVTKPFNPKELLARVNNVLRRCRAVPEEPDLRVGPYRMDLERRVLLDAAGNVVDLTRGEFDLLAELVAAQGHVLSRAELAEVVNPEGTTASFRSVDVLVSRLRQKLEADPGKPSLLLTAAGLGYRVKTS